MNAKTQGMLLGALVLSGVALAIASRQAGKKKDGKSLSEKMKKVGTVKKKRDKARRDT